MKKTQITFFFCCLTLIVLGQQDSTKVMSNRANNTQLKNQLELKIDQTVNDLTRDILDNTNRTQKNENTIGNLMITKVGSQALLISLFLSILGFFGLTKYFQTYLKRRMDKNVVLLEQDCQHALNRVQEAEIRTIQHIKNSEKDNEELRAQSQVLLISEATTPQNKGLHQIFVAGSAKVQFNTTEIKIKELTLKEVERKLLEKDGLHYADFQIIIIDNSRATGRKWDRDYINKYSIPFAKAFLEKGIGVLYFSNDQFFPSRGNDEFETLPKVHLLTYANAYPQAYNNAMTALKLQNLYA